MQQKIILFPTLLLVFGLIGSGCSSPTLIPVIEPTEISATLPPSSPTVEPTLEPLPVSECGISSDIMSEWPIIYCEEFNDNRNNWQIGQFDADLVTSTTKIQNGEFILEKVGKPKSGYTGGGVVSWYKLASASDFAVSATVKITSKNRDVAWGFTFRQDKLSTKNFYDFEIYKQGNYNFLKLSEGVWKPLLLNKSNNAIQQDAENTLTIVGEGNKFTFFVNGELINSFSDSSISGTVISLAMTQAEGATATYTIDNILVRAPSLQESSPAAVASTAGTPHLNSEYTLWNGIPILPGMITGKEELGDYQFTTKTSADDVNAFYESEMPKLGWELRPDMMVSSEELVFIKENTYVFFKIAPEGDLNLVYIHPFTP
jgi:hypothetical protein